MSWGPFRWFRPTRATVAPEHVTVLVHGCVNVRVHGEARGWVRCGRQVRRVWGTFDLTFVITGPARDVPVVVAGLGGRLRRTIDWRPRHDLHPPSAALARPAMPRIAPPARPRPPRARVHVRGVHARLHAPRAPRVPRLLAHRLTPSVSSTALEARREQLRRDTTTLTNP